MLQKLFLYLFKETIQAVITQRIIMFRKHLEKEEIIKAKPGRGPNV